MILAVPSVPGEASDRLQIEATIGFNGLVKLGRWNPIIVSVTNPGRRVDGVLSVRVKRGTAFRTTEAITYTKKLHLPAGARKRFSFSAPIVSSGLPIQISIHVAGESIVSSEYSVLGKAVHSPLMLALSRTASFDFLMSSGGPKIGGDILVTYPHIETLPRRWDAYNGVDFIALHNADLQMMDFDQSLAIEKWVDGGGVLFISGGTHLKRNIATLRGLLPVRVMGLARLTASQELSDALETDLEFVDPVPITMGTAVEGVVLAESDGIPLLVRRMRGAGVVFFFAGDIGTFPFSGRKARNGIWKLVQEAHNPRKPTSTPEGLFDDPIITALLDLEPSIKNSRLVALILISAYIGSVFIFILGRAYSPERALQRWIAIVLIPAVFSGAAYLLFTRNLLDARHLMLDITTIRAVPGGEYARAQKDVVLVSLNELEYSVSIDQQDTVVLGWGQEELHIQEDGGITVEKVSIRSWNLQAHKFVGYVPFSIEGSLRREEGNVKLSIENTSLYTIQDATLIYRGIPSDIGSIAPGESVKEVYQYISSPIDFREPEETHFNPVAEPQKDIVLTAMLNDPDLRLKMEKGAVILLGWLSDSLIKATSPTNFKDTIRINILISVMEIEGVGVNNAS